MIDNANLSDIQRLAISKMAPEVDRGKIDAGEHEVDFTVRIQGTLKISEDHESIIAAAVPWERVALLLLSRVNEATRERVVRDAMGDEKIDDQFKAEALAVADALKGKTRKTKLGQVRTELVAHEAA